MVARPSSGCSYASASLQVEVTDRIIFSDGHQRVLSFKKKYETKGVPDKGGRQTWSTVNRTDSVQYLLRNSHTVEYPLEKRLTTLGL